MTEIIRHLGWVIRPAAIDGWLICEPEGVVLYACSTHSEAVQTLSVEMGRIAQPSPGEIIAARDGASEIAGRFAPPQANRLKKQLTPT